MPVADREFEATVSEFGWIRVRAEATATREAINLNINVAEAGKLARLLAFVADN